MPVLQRAKQFMPFDAVSGLQQALRAKEHEMGLITRKELSEETRESINEIMMELRSGDEVTVTFFNEDGSHGAAKTNIENFRENDFEGGLEYASEYDDCIPDHTDDEGELITIEGQIKKIDETYRMLVLKTAVEEKYIDIDDIVGLSRK